MMKYLKNGLLVNAKLSDIEEILLNLIIQIMNNVPEGEAARMEVFHALAMCQDKIADILNSLAPEIERTAIPDN